MRSVQSVVIGGIQRQSGSCNQKQSEVVMGDQSQSESVRGNQGTLICNHVATRGNQRQSMCTQKQSRGNLSQSEAFKRPSEAIRGHQRPSEAIRATHLPIRQRLVPAVEQQPREHLWEDERAPW